MQCSSPVAGVWYSLDSSSSAAMGMAMALAMAMRVVEEIRQAWRSSPPALPITVACIVALSTLGWWWAKWIRSRKRPLLPLPPGRLGFPIIGETLEYARLARENRLEDFFGAREERYGEVFRTSLFGDETFCMPAPAGNKLLFAGENSLVFNRWPRSMVPLLGKYSINMQVGDEFKHTRGVLMAFLGPNALERYVGKVCEVAEKHIADHWEGRSEVVVHPLMKRLTMSVVFSLFLSIEDEMEKSKLIVPFSAYVAGMLQLPIDLPGTKFRKAKLSRLAIHKELDRYIAERRKQLKEETASPDQDLLSSLLTTPDGNCNLLIDDAVKDNILILMFAGHDTVTSTLSIALMFLARNPHCLEQTLKEQLEIKHDKKDGERLNWEDLKKMKYTWRVLQETLRMQPPAQGAFRKAKVDFEFAGYSIPKGSQLFWSVTRSHKQAKFFLDSEKFDPSRFEGKGPQPYTYVPFGGGPRICPGMEFAKMEMLVVMHYLVTRFVWSLMDPEEKVTINPMACPAKGLPVALCTRQ